ncbi:transporter substrate-binding domain-containing protein [Rhodococcus zopfii]|uniref:Transporter substrate-binding domain-containing protein n=1 Tax=Rhodococcus zopfii TaxID=43772 RepID=A0ABU3WWV3_9NOCA|nr:transporter substrate-binding domain-containing protein [Rhodococcus zopfii]MDV2478479.1 transporter substrate-binding domain-containing protein [Rhodococcus zopfii]
MRILTGHKSLAVAGATALALLLAGCGSDSSSGGEGSEDTFLIATSGTFRPITFDDGGKLNGYDIEVGTRIAEELGMKPEFVSGQLSGLLPGLNAGKFDAVMSGLTMTDERKESITFSTPYLADGAVAVVAAGNTTVTDVTALDGLVVGVIGGSGTEADIKGVGGFTELRAYPGAPEGFADVAAGRIDVFATGRIAAENYIEIAPNGKDLKIVGDVYAVKPAGVGLPKSDTEMKPKIDAVIEEMRADGSLAELQQKWFGFTIETSE